MKAELIFLLEKFPEFKEQIQSQFECDEEFQALCLDYFLCIRSLDYWEISIKKYRERFKEYVELKRVLENEMLQHINHDEHPEFDSPDSEASNLNSSDQK